MVINNDEWDHFEAFSTLSSPFNAPFGHRRVVFSAHGARARVGSRGSSVGPKMVQDHLGCKQVFLARFEPMVARFDPPKFPKSLENGL